MGLIESRYKFGNYLTHNPSWDIEDSPWKARKVFEILSAASLQPKSICEVGCGAGGVLAVLRSFYSETELFGFDIAQDAAQFWDKHKGLGVHYQIGDFFQLNSRRYDIILVLDVVEHVADPFDFLKGLLGEAEYYVFHFPLDLSAISVLREKPILRVRRKVGHIHYYTRGLVLALLQECNYEVLDCRYTGAAFAGPQRTWKTKLASLPRRLAYAVNKDAGVRLLGGETLIVLAKSAS